VNILKLIRGIITSLDRKFYLQTLMFIIGIIFIVRHVLYGQYMKKQKTLESLRSKKKLVGNLLNMEKNISKYDKTLFRTSDVGEILPYINKFLEENKVKVMTLTSTPIKKEFGIRTRSFLVKIESNFGQLLGLLNSLEFSERALLFSDITITRKRFKVEEMTDDLLKSPILISEIKIKVFTK